MRTRESVVGLIAAFALGAALVAQSPISGATKSSDQDKKKPVELEENQSILPTRILEFKVAKDEPDLDLTPITLFPSLCTSDGSLFIDMLNPKDLREHTIVSVNGKKYQTFSIRAITDLHEIDVISFFPSDSVVGLLVRATKSLPGQPKLETSSTGIPWSDYHNFIAVFDRDGSYKNSVQLPMSYSLSRLAILSSGEFIVFGYDNLNSMPELLVLDSAGRVLRSLDTPGSHTPDMVPAPGKEGNTVDAASSFMRTVTFTPFGQDILIWRMGDGDAVLDVRPGGGVREVQLQSPADSTFVSLISSNDRWIGHFRASGNAVSERKNNETDFYYEMLPQDASLSVRLIQTGATPMSIACEANGVYQSFKRDEKTGKMIVVTTD